MPLSILITAIISDFPKQITKYVLKKEKKSINEWMAQMNSDLLGIG